MKATITAILAAALIVTAPAAFAQSAPLDLFQAPTPAPLEGVTEDKTSATTAAIVERVAAAEFCGQTRPKATAPGSIVLWYERDQQGRCTITRAVQTPASRGQE